VRITARGGKGIDLMDLDPARHLPLSSSAAVGSSEPRL